MIEKFRKIISRAKNILTPGVPILLYHRVAESTSDPQLLCVTPQHFAEHLDVLRKNKYPIGLKGLSRSIRDLKIPRHGVAITFDDGYADNLVNLKPILEQYAVPATVFIAGANIGGTREFWWDELERILLQPGNLPERIQLTVAGKSYSWDLGKISDYSQKDFQLYKWDVLKTKDLSPRHTVYRSLCQLLRPLPDHERQKVLEELMALAGLPADGRLTHRSLSADEIIELQKGGLIEVGAHTMTHSVLSILSLDEQQDEISSNKIQLEEILGSKVAGFSYPYGDYAVDTVKLVRELGFEYACALYPELVRKQSDPFQLPRFLVRDWDGDEFARQLKDFYASEISK